MSAQILWSIPALDDMDAIALYHNERGDYDVAQNLFAKIFHATEILAKNPSMAKAGRVSGTREWLVKKAPYIIVYQDSNKELYILRVIHTARSDKAFFANVCLPIEHNDRMDDEIWLQRAQDAAKGGYLSAEESDTFLKKRLARAVKNSA